MNEKYTDCIETVSKILCNCSTCKNNSSPHFYKLQELKGRIAYQKYHIGCSKPPFAEVQVLGLIDNAIDIKQLISQEPKNIDKSILIQVLGDFITGDRITDQRRTINISGKAQVNVSGAAALGLGDISGTVANTINQLASFENEPNKKTLKELLIQLHNTILEEEELDKEEKEEAIEQIQAISSALSDSQNRKMKRKAKAAIGIIEDISAAFPPSAGMVGICNQLPDLIGKIF